MILYYLKLSFSILLYSYFLGRVDSVEGVNWAYTSPHLIGLEIGSSGYYKVRFHIPKCFLYVNYFKGLLALKYLESFSNCISDLYS